MITMLIVVLLVVLLVGGGWGYTSGHYTYNSPIGIILIILAILLVFALLGGPRLGYWHY